MKRKLLFVLCLVLAAFAFTFAACQTTIDDGKIDGADKLPCTVEVEGLEGVSGTVSLQPVSAAAKETALTAVKSAYYIDDGATTYAVDISIVDNGEEVEIGKPVTVSIELKNAVLPLESYVVFHIHDGVATEIVPTVSDGKLTFTVENFSVFLVAPKHTHTESDWQYDAESGKDYKKCTVCHKVLDERNHQEQSQAADNLFVGITLKYKADSFSGANQGYDGGDVSQNRVEEIMSGITVSMFNDGTVSSDGKIVSDASFEMYSEKDGGIEWAIFGTYSADAEEMFCEMQVESYYSGATHKYYHGYHKVKADMYILEPAGCYYDADSGVYGIDGYITNFKAASMGQGVVAKGEFKFEKVNESPVHLADLPEDTDDDHYERFIENKVYSFRSASDNNYASRFSDATVSVFTENYIEYSVAGMVYCGDYQIEENEDGKYAVVYSASGRYIDGEWNTWAVSFNFIYDGTADEITLNENGVAITFAYNAAVAPERYVVPPLADNWNASALTAALQTIGASQDTAFPKLDDVSTMEISQIKNDAFTVTCRMSSNKTGYETAVDYKNSFYGDYEMITYTSDYDVYLSANGEYKFYVTVNNKTQDGYTVLTITFNKSVLKYPSEQIAAYMQKRGWTDGIAQFVSASAVEYRFDEKEGSLYVGLRQNADHASVLSQFVSLLTGTAGFEPEIVEKSTYYASANRQFALLLASGVNERPCVKIIFYGPEILPIREYPGAAISAYLNGVSDTMLSLDTAGATGYDLTTGVRGQTLNVYLPLTVDGYAAANAVRDRFTNADYTMMDFNIMAEDGVSMRFADCLVSPNKEIAVFVFGYTAENMVEWFGNDVDYTYYYAEIVNLKNYANVAFMNGIRAELYKYIYEVGENFYFNGNIYGVYSDKSEKQLYVEDCIISEPDMNTSGTKTVTITLRKNPELTATVTITVSAANAITGISVSQYRTTYNIGDRFDKSCTVTALYSDGSTSEIRYTACNFTEPDMNTAGTKEITVTYTTNGNVFTATMSITVNERRVNGEGGVG